MEAHFYKFLPEEEIKNILNEIDPIKWEFSGYSNLETEDNKPMFWYKEIIDTKACSILKTYIEKVVKRKITIQRAYVNGQAHSQSGFWHRDVDINDGKHNTLVVFLQDWKPEYGGHLLVRGGDEIFSFLPERNTAVMFDSYLMHMGLEPSCYCKKQRESIAIKFRIED